MTGLRLARLAQEDSALLLIIRQVFEIHEHMIYIVADCRLYAFIFQLFCELLQPEARAMVYCFGVINSIGSRVLLPSLHADKIYIH